MSDQGNEGAPGPAGTEGDRRLDGQLDGQADGQPDHLADEARAHHRAGRLEEAAAVYAALLARRPRDAGLLHRLGAVRHQQGRHADALTLIHRAVSIEPADSKMRNTLGSVLLAVGRADEAATAFAHAAESDAEFAEAFYNLGTARQVLQRLAEAQAAYRRAIELRPEMVEAHTNLGVVLRARGETAAAVESFRHAIALEPRFAEAHLNLGLALADQGHWEEALGSFERSIALRPGLGEAWYYAGLALRALGRADDAGERFQRAAEVLPHFVPAHQALLAELERIGSPSAGAARANLGTALLAGNRPREALAEFERIIASGARENTRAVAHKWVALTALGEHDAARELVDFERFFATLRLPCPPGFADIAAFNGALATHVQSHPTLERDPEENATRSGLHSGNLLAGSAGPVAALAEAFDTAVADYRARLDGDRGHPFIASAPAHWSLYVWAVVLDAQGHQVPHLHPNAWLSGVYYVQVPAVVEDHGTHAGWIEFGEPTGEFPLSVIPRDRHRVRPEEGKLLLFPSYFYHHTVPFHGEGRRISIAFDVRRNDC